MKWLTTAVLAAFLTLSAFADTASWVRDQRRIAAEQSSAGRKDQSLESLRLAISAARRAGLRAELSRCLNQLAWLRWAQEHEAGTKGEEIAPLAIVLWQEAAKVACEAGESGLELEALNAIASQGDLSDESRATDRLDAAIACGDYATITDVAFFLEGTAEAAVASMDQLAEAALLAKGKDAGGAISLLSNVREQARSNGWKRVEAVACLRLARLQKGPAALADAEAALKAFANPRNLRGQAEAHVERAKSLQSDDASKALAQALRFALELQDAELEIRVLQSMAASAPVAEQAALLARVAKAENRRHEAVLERAERAAKDGEDVEASVAALRAERLRRPADAAAVDRWLVVLGAEPAKRKELEKGYREKLVAALRSKDSYRISIGLEILGRTDAWPVLAEVMREGANDWRLTAAFESLATREDMPALLEMCTAADSNVAEAAAAAVARLATDADLPAIRKVLEKKPGETASIYLGGVLAASGDLAALRRLRTTLAGANATLAHHAAVALAHCGFNGTMAGLEERGADMHAGYRFRILARAPKSWGLCFAESEDGVIEASRANFVRRIRDRVHGIGEDNNIWSIMYRLPATPEEARICGTGWILRAGQLIENDGSGDILSWIGNGLGYDLYGAEERLKKHKERNEADFALADLEAHRYGEVAGSQTRVLTVNGGEAWARVRVTATPEIGLIVDNTLQLPFLFTWETQNGHNGSLAGAIGQIALQISLAGLVPEAEIRIPGCDPFKAQIKADAENRLWVYALLPSDKEGEGLDPGTAIPVKRIAQGTVTLSLQVEQSRARMTFPLAILVPPAKDKPDLVAVDLTIQPAVPEIGQEAELRLRTRNTGKAPEKNALLNVRFAVLNPQTGEGRRTIDVRLTEAKGWQPGAWRYFEARPTAVRGWYMNSWSHTWTLELGDTRLVATVDAENRLEEDSEENNTVELEVPLYVGEEEGKRLAGEELLAEMSRLLKQVGEAKTEGDARGPGYEAVRLLARAKVSSPEIELAERHLKAAVETQIHRLRVRAALERARTLASDPRANQEALRDIIVELTDAETDLMDSGVPVKEDAVTYWRNRVQVAANLTSASADYAELAGIVSGTEDAGERLRKVGENLNRLDGALQCIRYVRDRADGGEYDNADPIEGTCSIFGQGHPGLSKLHQAMFKAEIDYVDRGFRKEANALDALAALISGEEGAQERLDAAVRDVDQHVSAGPFNENARKEILQGAVKDIPVIGKLLDAIWSWK